MKTKDLIEKLSQNVTPVKPLPNVFVRTSVILFTMIIGSGIIFLFFSHRPDLRQAITHEQFILGAFVLFLGWLSSSYSLSILQLPRVEKRKYLAFGLTLLSILVLGYLLSSVRQNAFTDGLASEGMKCSLDIIFLSSLPFVGLFLILRKSAPLHSIYSGLNIGVCAAMLGAFLLQFSCPSENPAHLLMWHVMVPFLVLAGLGSLLGKKVLKW